MRLKPFEFAGNDGFSIGGSETSGEAFSEFKLANVSAELIIYPPYPSDPLADWPVLLYTISFVRSWQPYIRGYLVSQLIFNIIGFACFWLPVQSGERLALAITAMLSAVAADLVVVAKLPSAAELTWMQKFSLVSQVFAAFCVLEGVVVSYFYFLTGMPRNKRQHTCPATSLPNPNPNPNPNLPPHFTAAQTPQKLT